jgi:signal transduction histidine kinase
MARAGELTSGIVHEVRNGLGTLAGNVRLLERAPGAGPQVAEIARSLRAECEALESVIRRIVEFVRTEKLQPAELDLKRLLERVASREQHGRAGAEVRLGVPADLSCMGDEDLLERVFENLLRNAREATGPEGHVDVSAEQEPGGVVVRVEDDGPGMPASLRGGLRPFATTKAGGLGLGLPTALKIVTLHGGSLRLLPREPRGLVALVRLPRVDRREGGTNRDARPPGPAAPGGAGST